MERTDDIDWEALGFMLGSLDEPLGAIEIISVKDGIARLRCECDVAHPSHHVSSCRVIADVWLEPFREQQS